MNRPTYIDAVGELFRALLHRHWRPTPDDHRQICEWWDLAIPPQVVRAVFLDARAHEEKPWLHPALGLRYFRTWMPRERRARRSSS